MGKAVRGYMDFTNQIIDLSAGSHPISFFGYVSGQIVSLTIHYSNIEP